MESLVKIGKWSDGEKWLEKRDGAREVSEPGEDCSLKSQINRLQLIQNRIFQREKEREIEEEA